MDAQPADSKALAWDADLDNLTSASTVDLTDREAVFKFAESVLGLIT